MFEYFSVFLYRCCC